jgi:hypothetical protein
MTLPIAQEDTPAAVNFLSNAGVAPTKRKAAAPFDPAAAVS